jgi:hypothetical protein
MADEGFVMNPTDIYSQCQTAAGGLLSAIDSRDARGVEDSLTRLQGCLSVREEGSRMRADRLHEERLDALEGVTEELARAVRRSGRHRYRKLREAAPLLRHLTTARS